MTPSAIRAHAIKNKLPVPKEIEPGGVLSQTGGENHATGRTGSRGAIPKPVKMTRPEREYGLILEAMKRKGEVVDYRYQGLSLAWGADPATGRLMRYKCDWLVVMRSDCGVGSTEDGGWTPILPVKIIEVKGAHIWPKDMIRFKGCRSEWPMFQFELHQLAGGEWRRVL